MTVSLTELAVILADRPNRLRTANMPTSATIAMAAIDTSSSNVSPIEAATRVHNLVYLGYVVVLVLAAFFTWLAWKTGNKVQDAIRADANARIAEADSKAEIAKHGAATANEGAAKANERATALENANLTLRGQVASLETAASEAKKDVDTLQKAAADAVAAQQRVEIALSEQRERTANAEIQVEHERTARLAMQKELAPRSLSFPFPNQRFKHLAGTTIGISFVSDERETRRLANAIKFATEQSGWVVSSIAGDDHPYLSMQGVVIVVNDPSGEKAASELESLLLANFIEAKTAIRRPLDPPDPALRVIVGTRPTPYFDELNADEPVPIDERHKELIAQRKKDDERRVEEREEEMRRLHDEWFPPGVNKIVM